MRLIVCVLILAAGALPVHAQTTTPTSTATTSAGSADTISPSPATNRVTETPRDTAAVLNVATQDRVTNLAANLSNRMEAIIQRLTQIADRTEERIDILSDRGLATEDAAAELATARASLTQAASTLRNVDTAVAAVVSSPTPRAAWPELRTTYTTAATAIRNGKTGLVETIDTIKRRIANGGTRPSSSTNSTI